MRKDAAGQDGKKRPKAKIFISYSRKDLSFADRLEAALKARGFEPHIDRERYLRLRGMVEANRGADRRRRHDRVRAEPGLGCLRAWRCKEVAFAASSNKRFAPIVCRPIDNNAVPEALAKLNFIFFDDETKFEASADRLAEALDTDIAWIRQHTEFGELARRWALAKGPRGLLLRSPVLEDAEHWIAARPSGAPAPTDETQTFIRQSRQATTGGATSSPAASRPA